MMLCPKHLIAFSGSADVWSALSGAVENNPTLSLLGLIATVFAAGVGVGRLLREHKLEKVTATVAALRTELESAKGALSKVEDRRRQANEKLDEIGQCLSPADIKSTLAKSLSHWPVEKHDLVVVSLIPQLLATPGEAWLITPAGTSLVTVEFDSKRGGCKIGAKSDSLSDPLKPLREFVQHPEALKTVLFDLAVHGITSVAREVAPNQIKRIVARQGPGTSWHIKEETLERVAT